MKLDIKGIISNKYVMKAIGSMMRGEDPMTFIKNLALTTPELQGFDLNDLEGTATTVCKDKNINKGELSSQIEEFANSYTNKL